MKTKAPQYELPGTAEPFNLAGQMTSDGELVARAQAKLAQERNDAARLQAELNPILNELQVSRTSDTGHVAHVSATVAKIFGLDKLPAVMPSNQSRQ